MFIGINFYIPLLIHDDEKSFFYNFSLILICEFIAETETQNFLNAFKKKTCFFHGFTESAFLIGFIFLNFSSDVLPKGSTPFIGLKEEEFLGLTGLVNGCHHHLSFFRFSGHSSLSKTRFTLSKINSEKLRALPCVTDLKTQLINCVI